MSTQESAIEINIFCGPFSSIKKTSYSPLSMKSTLPLAFHSDIITSGLQQINQQCKKIKDGEIILIFDRNPSQEYVNVNPITITPIFKWIFFCPLID